MIFWALIPGVAILWLLWELLTAPIIPAHVDTDAGEWIDEIQRVREVAK